MAQKVFGITIGKDKKAVTPKTASERPTPVSSWKPTLPAVNAIPVSILNKYENKELIRKFAAIGGVVVIIFGALFGYSIFASINHQQELTEFESSSTELNQQIQALQPYEAYKSAVANKMTTLSTYLSTDVNVSGMLNSLYSAAAANGVTFESLDINISDASPTGEAVNSGCVQVDPFNPSTSIGCITFSGSQPNSEALNNLFNALQGQEGFVDAFLESATYESSEGGTGNTFNGSIAFTDAFYSNKYTNLTLDINTLINGGGLDQAIDPNAAPAAEPTPAAEATDTTTGAENNE
jgi:hypothetical protein